MNRDRFHRPPRSLRRRGVTLDNIAIVPGSLMSHKAQYQAIANQLPQGDVLVVLPSGATPPKQTMQAVVRVLQAKGKRVLTVPVGQIAAGHR